MDPRCPLCPAGVLSDRPLQLKGKGRKGGGEGKIYLQGVFCSQCGLWISKKLCGNADSWACPRLCKLHTAGDLLAGQLGWHCCVIPGIHLKFGVVCWGVPSDNFPAAHTS